MIPRYARPEMARIWTQDAKYEAWLQVELAWLPTSEDAAVGRFVAFMRDEARSRRLL